MNPPLSAVRTRLRRDVRIRRSGALLGMLLAFLCAPYRMAAGTELAMGTGTGTPGTLVVVPITLATEAPVLAVQFDLLSPPGSLTSQGAIANDSSSLISVHSREVEPGVRRVLVYSRNSAPLPNGVLASIAFQIPPATPFGRTPLSLRGAVVSDGSFRPAGPLTLTEGAVIVASALSAQFVAALFDSQGVLHLELTAAGGRTLSVQASPDLRFWTNLTLNLPASGSIQLTDTNAVTAPYRFYRAIVTP